MREYPDLLLNPPLVDATVVIPTVDDFAATIACVDRLREFASDHTVDYVVVDDGSDSECVDQLAQHQSEHGYTLRRTNQNLGFSAAVNLGWKYAAGRLLVTANSDVQVRGPWLAPWEKLFSDDARLGVSGARLLYPDDSPQHFGCWKIPGQVLFPHVVDPELSEQTRYVWRVTGSMLAVRRETAADIGGLSISYGLAWEDVDYCLEVWRRGWRVAYCSDVVAQHVEGATRGRTRDEKMSRPQIWTHREFAAENYFSSKWFGLAHVEDFMLVRGHVNAR